MYPIWLIQCVRSLGMFFERHFVRVSGRRRYTREVLVNHVRHHVTYVTKMAGTQKMKTSSPITLQAKWLIMAFLNIGTFWRVLCMAGVIAHKGLQSNMVVVTLVAVLLSTTPNLGHMSARGHCLHLQTFRPT